MEYRFIDMENYPRKAHFEYFRSLAYPYVGVTVEVDVTDLVDLCKSNGMSFYLSFLHAATLAANTVPEFRHRIHEGKIVEYDFCGSSHIELMPDTTYCYCTLYHDKPFDEYMEYAEKTRQIYRRHPSIKEDDDVEGLFFITTLPWTHYTSFVQPVAGGDDSNPRISWGGYREDHDGRKMLPVTVMTHHALVDGLQLTEFYRHLNTELAKITGKLFVI